MDRHEIGLSGTRPVDASVNPLASTLVLDEVVSPHARTLQLPPAPARAAPRPVVGEATLSEAADRAEPLGVIVRRIHLIEG